MPDFNCWSNTYVQMQFDADPALELVTDTEPKIDPARVGQAFVMGFSPIPLHPVANRDTAWQLFSFPTWQAAIKGFLPCAVTSIAAYRYHSVALYPVA